jgi:hypothetical protein
MRIHNKKYLNWKITYENADPACLKQLLIVSKHFKSMKNPGSDGIRKEFTEHTLAPKLDFI